MTKIQAKATKGTDGWLVWGTDTGPRHFFILGVVATLEEAKAAVLYLQS